MIVGRDGPPDPTDTAGEIEPSTSMGRSTTTPESARALSGAWPGSSAVRAAVNASEVVRAFMLRITPEYGRVRWPARKCCPASHAVLSGRLVFRYAFCSFVH